jgi:two-component system nitrogen regulation response regulator GlnG
MPTLLIVDDEPNVRYSLEKYLRSQTLDVICAASAKEAVEKARAQPPDAVILDVRLPDMSGLEVFDRIRHNDPRLPVIIITAHATTEIAIEAMKLGAFEYLLKPVDLHQLREVVSQAIHSSCLSRVPAVFEQEDGAETGVDRIVGLSAPMQEVYKKISRVAPQDVNVLVLGESGTGKELVARAIYSHSRRSKKLFLAINCAAIPETLLESELFGHERGSFTGADHRRIGKFEQAQGGTVFLDEIGDMTFATQAKILRLLQDGRFERVGGNETIATDIRVIAATNRNLAELLAAGKFREDLFYRLNVFAIHLPPLRERMEDLPKLVEHFVRQFSREPGRGQPIIAPESMELLEGYDWPGNVRELQSAIQYALVQATGNVLALQHFPPALHCRPPVETPAPGTDHELPGVAALVRQFLESGQPEIYRQAQAALDRIVLGEVLRHTRGNQVSAAQLLGISRTTLRAKLSALGLEAKAEPEETESNSRREKGEAS